MLNALAATPKCMHPDRQCPSRWPPSPPVFFPISTNFTSTLGIPPSSPELKPASIKSYSQPGLLLTLPSSSSRAKELYNPKAFITHAALLDQACAHCPIFPTAASRRSLGRVSVPVWLIILSDQLRIVGLRPFPDVIPNRKAGSHVLLTRAPLRPKPSFDLHVLGMPPAFVLSQDQTLRCTDDPHCADPHQETNTPRPQRLPTAAACASLLTTRRKIETAKSLFSLPFLRRRRAVVQRPAVGGAVYRRPLPNRASAFFIAFCFLCSLNRRMFSSEQTERTQFRRHIGRHFAPYRADGGEILGSGLRGQIAPALERPMRGRHRLHPAGGEVQGAIALAFLVGIGVDGENGLAHQDAALDHPIDRSAGQQLVAALGQAAGVDGDAGLAAGGYGAAVLKLRQMVEVADADGKLDQMERHGGCVVSDGMNGTAPSIARLLT
ncbi:hypothetical protein Lal_00005164 [Lupinus albus]|nr:hypothetical protein Lal_00005164 [Lupinus albus]